MRVETERSLPNYFEGFLDDGDGEMRTVVYQTGNVVFRHFGKLLLKYTFQASEDDQAFASIVIVDHSELNLASALLYDCWLRQNSTLVYSLTILSSFAPLTFSGNGINLRDLFSRSGETVWEFFTRLLALGASGSSTALRLFTVFFISVVLSDVYGQLYDQIVWAPLLRILRPIHLRLTVRRRQTALRLGATTSELASPGGRSTSGN